MAKQNPKYRGIYAYDATKKPAGTAPLTKASPFYRGIYCYDAANKPSGVFLEGDDPDPLLMGNERAAMGRR